MGRRVGSHRAPGLRAAAGLCVTGGRHGPGPHDQGGGARRQPSAVSVPSLTAHSADPLWFPPREACRREVASGVSICHSASPRARAKPAGDLLARHGGLRGAPERHDTDRDGHREPGRVGEELRGDDLVDDLAADLLVRSAEDASTSARRCPATSRLAAPAESQPRWRPRHTSSRATTVARPSGTRTAGPHPGAAVERGPVLRAFLRPAVRSEVPGVPGRDPGFYMRAAAGGKTRLVAHTRSRITRQPITCVLDDPAACCGTGCWTVAQPGDRAGRPALAVFLGWLTGSAEVSGVLYRAGGGPRGEV